MIDGQWRICTVLAAQRQCTKSMAHSMNDSTWNLPNNTMSTDHNRQMFSTSDHELWNLMAVSSPAHLNRPQDWFSNTNHDTINSADGPGPAVNPNGNHTINLTAIPRSAQINQQHLSPSPHNEVSSTSQLGLRIYMMPLELLNTIQGIKEEVKEVQDG